MRTCTLLYKNSFTQEKDPCVLTGQAGILICLTLCVAGREHAHHGYEAEISCKLPMQEMSAGQKRRVQGTVNSM